MLIFTIFALSLFSFAESAVDCDLVRHLRNLNFPEFQIGQIVCHNEESLKFHTFSRYFYGFPRYYDCQFDGLEYIKSCDSNPFTNYENDHNNYKVTAPQIGRSETGRGKIYDQCELARELYYVHLFPMEEIATWVCIAKQESNFDTSAIGRLNADGSEDHGIFQISDIYWCGNGKSCGLSCDQLEDNDITDDVECVKKIFKETLKFSGDGFTAWTTYPRCKGDSVNEYIRNCF